MPQLKYKKFYGQHYVKGIGIVMGRFNDASARFVVGSAQTLIERGDVVTEPLTRADIAVTHDRRVVVNPHSSRKYLISPRMDEIIQHGIPDVLMFDEAHHAVSDNSLLMAVRLRELRELLNLPALRIVGFTATPLRSDGRGLNSLFQTVFISRDFMWGQKHGYLAPFAPPIRVRIRTRSQDTGVHDISDFYDQVFKAWQERAQDRFCVGFTSKYADESGVDVSRNLARYFQRQGVMCAHTDGEMCILPDGNSAPADRRGEIYAAFNRGDVRVIWSYGVGIEGLDLPRADCLLWLRSTENVALRTQAVGRILRLHPDKKDALILDFTDQDIVVDPIGSLAGYRVDPLTLKYTADPVEEDADEADETRSFSDRRLVTAQGEGRHYQEARIISRSKEDWHINEEGLLTLMVSRKDGLAILPPDPVNYQQAHSILEALEMFAEAADTPSLLVNALRQKDETYLEKVWEYAGWAQVFYGQYTLWHVSVNGTEAALVHRGFIGHDPSLNIVLAEASAYIGSHGLGEDFIMKRSKSWKKHSAPSDKQLHMMRSLNLPTDKVSSAGEASRMISSHLIARPIREVQQAVAATIRKILDSA
jgi:superfamily II DNA or RNA helicase